MIWRSKGQGQSHSSQQDQNKWAVGLRLMGILVVVWDCSELVPEWGLFRCILARDKRRKCLATGSEELSWFSVCAPKWHFKTSLAKNMLGFSPFWASKSKTHSQQATKIKQIIGFLFRPIREEHQQQSSPGSGVARWVGLKLEKPSKIPHILSRSTKGKQQSPTERNYEGNRSQRQRILNTYT